MIRLLRESDREKRSEEQEQEKHRYHLWFLQKLLLFYSLINSSDHRSHEYFSATSAVVYSFVENELPIRRFLSLVDPRSWTSRPARFLIKSLCNERKKFAANKMRVLRRSSFFPWYFLESYAQHVFPLITNSLNKVILHSFSLKSLFQMFYLK